MLSLFRALLSDDVIEFAYGSVSVAIIQTENFLDEIVKSFKIQWIRIEYNRPNPDDHHDIAGIMSAKMAQAGAHKLAIELAASARSGQVVLDEDLEQFARSSLDHGRIDAKVTDNNGQFQTLSSQDHPKIEKQKYDPDVTTDHQAFRSLVRQIRGRP